MALQQEIRKSPRVTSLLSERDDDGRIHFHPYNKWCGAHWILATIADLGYPTGDDSLIPLREQVYEWILSEKHRRRIARINGRVRRCASQEGNVVYSLLTLGLADSRTEELVRRLIEWQWPDGGWNCDKRPEATNASFHESLIPLRALALHSKVTGSAKSQAAAERAADIFLKRSMYKRQRDGSIISEDFTKLHYPPYWHYDVLFGLKVMAEAGFLEDERCSDALDLLESKRLPDGGFPAEAKYYRVGTTKSGARSLVDWGGVNKKRMNEFVSADVLYILREAGRLSET